MDFMFQTWVSSIGGVRMKNGKAHYMRHDGNIAGSCNRNPVEYHILAMATKRQNDSIFTMAIGDYE